MLQLPNNCRAGKFTVSPANWKSQSAKVNTTWKIQYWFYDDNLKKRKLVSMKGMNRLTTLKEKQDYVNDIINYETDLIKVRGWNHITESFSVVTESELSAATPVIDALEHGFKKVEAEATTLTGIEGVLRHVVKAVKKLRMDRYAIRDINPWHVETIIEKVGEGNPRWTNNTFNHYKKYLSIIFKRLKKSRCISSNPVGEVEKRKTVHRMRQELTPEERVKVKELLSARHPRFWTFVNIFFHSGSRETELLRLRKCDIDIPGQRFKVLIKKGKQGREEWRPIKDIVLPDWEKALEGAGDTDYIFSKGLMPGHARVRPEQVTRRWNRHVKIKLGITADLYSLKHSNLDEMSEALQAQKEAVTEASEFAGHTTPVVTLKHYLKGQDGRKNKTVRGVRNEF